MSCVFCRLAAGELPATRVFEDADVLAFRDSHPQAPTHVLVIPKLHVPSLHELADARLPLEISQGRFADRPSQLVVRQDEHGNLWVRGEVWSVAHGTLDFEPT